MAPLPSHIKHIAHWWETQLLLIKKSFVANKLTHHCVRQSDETAKNQKTKKNSKFIPDYSILSQQNLWRPAPLFLLPNSMIQDAVEIRHLAFFYTLVGGQISLSCTHHERSQQYFGMSSSWYFGIFTFSLFHPFTFSPFHLSTFSLFHFSTFSPFHLITMLCSCS